MELDADPELAPALREALTEAGFTHDAVADLLGDRAHAALARNETVPALRRTDDGGPLATLVRIFLLQTPVPAAHAERALPDLVDRMVDVGMLTRCGHQDQQVAARLDCRPYSVAGGVAAHGAADDQLWVVADLTPGLDGVGHRVTPEHVLGISSASTSLAQLTVRHPVATALDLGTGCGVQALHLARHADRVVATDVNPRALAMARFNAALNGVADRVEVREGSLFAPVHRERFDLVTTNPPFVISPGSAPGEPVLVYRDSDLPGDQVVEDVVRGSAEHLAPDGWCQVLASWAIRRDQPWQERVGSWLPAGHDALVVQREVLDPAAYVEMWLKDSGHHPATGAASDAYRDYRRRYDAWLAWFDAEQVEGVGFGWINVHAGGRREAGSHDGDSHVELLDWPYELEQPIAPAVAAWGDAVLTQVGLRSRLVTREDVVQESHGPPGAEDPSVIVLRQQRGFRRARSVDTVEAALVGACDGELSVAAILDAVAELLGLDPARNRTAYLPVARELVDQGFLTVSGATPEPPGE